MNKEKEEFIINCISDEIFKSIIESSEIYDNIGIIPIYIYDEPDSKKDGLASMILGKKEDEKYKFLTRKIPEESTDIFGSLYDEFYEVFDIKLTYEELKKRTIDIIRQKIENQNTILFVYHSIKIKEENKTYIYSKIKYIAIEDIQIKTHKISKSVRQMLYKLINFYHRI
jgi:hypothetical protein